MMLTSAASAMEGAAMATKRPVKRAIRVSMISPRLRCLWGDPCKRESVAPPIVEVQNVFSLLSLTNYMYCDAAPGSLTMTYETQKTSPHLTTTSTTKPSAPKDIL